MHNKDFFDREFEQFDKQFNRMQKYGIIWFVICAVVSLVVLGFGIWAIYALVTWLTSK